MSPRPPHTAAAAATLAFAWLLLPAVAGAGGAVLGCSSFDEAIGRLESQDPDERREAIYDLAAKVDAREEPYGGEAEREAIGKAFRARLEDPIALVRQVALDGLALVEGARAAAPIVDRMGRDRDAWVRKAAARALGRVGSRTSVAAIAERLRKAENPDVRVEAARALRAHRQQAALEPLYLALADEDEVPSVRYPAYLALVQTTGRSDLADDPRAWRRVIMR